MKRSSQTADAATAMRYVATLTNRCTIFDDPLAATFLTPAWRVLLRTAALRRLVTGVYNHLVPGMVGDVLIRSRYVQDLLGSQGCLRWRQYVVLGAGWDTTALRACAMHGRLRAFELDHPFTHREKKKRLTQRGVTIPANLEFVTIDFERDRIGPALDRAGFDREIPALFFLGGVTFYLSEAAVHRTLRDVASCMPAGGEFVFDYLDARALDRRSRFRGARRLAAMAMRRGEPFRWGADPADLPALLSSCGFDLVKHYVGAEQRSLHSARTIGIFPPAEYIHLAHARRAAVVRHTSTQVQDCGVGAPVL